MILATAAFGQAADICGSAPTVGEGTYSWDVAGATNDAAGSCGGTATAPDVWLNYVPTFTGDAIIETCGLTTFDSVLAAFDACGGFELACNDDNCGLQSRISVAVQQGVPVLVRIARYNGATEGNGSVAIFAPAPPANDLCGAAVPVGEGDYAFDNNFATTDAAGSCGFGGDPGGADVWYIYTPSGTGNARINTCGSAVDTHINAFDACGGFELACNDDFCGLQSQIDVPVTSGVPILIRVAGYAGDTGTGNMNIALLGDPPANDACSAPEAVGDGSFNFDTSAATNDGAGTCGASGASPDVWYLYTAPVDGCAVIETCGSGFDTVLGIWADCFTESVCNDDACGLQSRVLVTGVTAGQQILVRVSGYNGGSGPGVLTTRVDPALPYSTPGAFTPEGEDCLGDDAVDTVNGGCNSEPDVFGAINCGETIVGTSSGYLFTGLNYRDTDWFQFTLAADDTVTLNGQAQFAAQMFILNSDCAAIQILSQSLNTACSPDLSISTFLSAGTYVAFISPQTFDVNPCGNGDDEYWMTLSLGAGCGGAACDPDVNCDGSPDQGDVACMILAVAGDTSCICQDPDFNLDGSADQGDVSALIGVVAGQPCP